MRTKDVLKQQSLFRQKWQLIVFSPLKKESFVAEYEIVFEAYDPQKYGN
jgi:hypothetical protein